MNTLPFELQRQFSHINGKERQVVITMDTCSDSTNIDEEFAKEMGLHIEETGLVRNINFLESSATVHSDLVSFYAVATQ